MATSAPEEGAAWRDPYVDPATGILRDRVGAVDQATLDWVESTFVMLRTYERERAKPGAFDLPHLQRLHGHLFGDVYAWAGALRTVDISKGGTAFAHHRAITPAATALFGELAQEEHLRGLDADRFSARAGHYLGEINVLHPFREGNGRAQRAFVSELARGTGFQIAWEGVARADMTRASVEAYAGDSRALARLLREHLVQDEPALGSRAPPVHPRVTSPARTGTFAGPIVAAGPRAIIQLVEGDLVEHPRARLYGDTGALSPGTAVVITYAAGLGNVVDPRDRGRGR